MEDGRNMLSLEIKLFIWEKYHYMRWMDSWTLYLRIVYLEKIWIWWNWERWKLLRIVKMLWRSNNTEMVSWEANSIFYDLFLI